MSLENVEVVRRAVEAYVAGDVSATETLLDPEVEWKQVEEPATAHGAEGVLQALARWDEVWDELHTEGQEYIDAGDKVLALIRMRGRGKGSGVTVEQSSYLLFTVREGRIVRMHEFGPGGRAEALKAVGLRE